MNKWTPTREQIQNEVWAETDRQFLSLVRQQVWIPAWDVFHATDERTVKTHVIIHTREALE